MARSHEEIQVHQGVDVVDADLDTKRRRIPPAVRTAVLDRDGRRCRRCGWRPGMPITQQPKRRRRRRYPPVWSLDIDHITPVTRGGTNDISNLQTLCTGCNARKGAN